MAMRPGRSSAPRRTREMAAEEAAPREGHDAGGRCGRVQAITSRRLGRRAASLDRMMGEGGIRLRTRRELAIPLDKERMHLGRRLRGVLDRSIGTDQILRVASYQLRRPLVAQPAHQ